MAGAKRKRVLEANFSPRRHRGRREKKKGINSVLSVPPSSRHWADTPRRAGFALQLETTCGRERQREPAGEIPNEVRENSMANSSAERKHAHLVACAVEWLRRDR